MNAGQNNKKPDISFAKGARVRIFSWTRAARGALKPIKFQFRQIAPRLKKHALAVFAILLTVAIMEFNYYQARLTREYLRALLVSAAQINGDIDALEAQLTQLNMKIDALGAKLDKLPLSSSPVQGKTRPNVIYLKPR
jgi:hypothetical protein